MKIIDKKIMTSCGVSPNWHVLKKNYLKYSTAPISEIREADDCAHFHNMDSMWGE